MMDGTLDQRRPTLAARHPTLLFAVLVSACGGGADAIAESTTRDSAGVTIVETAMDEASPPSWHLSDAPLLTLGSVDGSPDEVLYRVVGAFRTSDGRLVVANAGSHEIRWYDSQGRVVARSGGEGDGPGEYKSIFGAGSAGGDSVAVYDFRERRVTIIGPDAAVTRTFRLEDPPRPPGTEEPEPGWPLMVGRLANGEFLASISPSKTPGTAYEGIPEDTVEYVRYDATGARVGVAVQELGNESYVVSTANSVSTSSVSFGRNTEVALGPAEIWVGRTDTEDVRRYGPTGDLHLIVRRVRAPRPVTEEDVAAYKERRIAAIENPEWRQRFLEIFEKTPFAKFHPTFAGIQVDPDGYLWVREYAFDPSSDDEAPSEWSVFDPDGNLVASVTVPAGRGILSVGRNHIVGRRTDDLSVEYVELYGLERTPEALESALHPQP